MYLREFVCQGIMLLSDKVTSESQMSQHYHRLLDLIMTMLKCIVLTFRQIFPDSTENSPVMIKMLKHVKDVVLTFRKYCKVRPENCRVMITPCRNFSNFFLK